MHAEARQHEWGIDAAPILCSFLPFITPCVSVHLLRSQIVVSHARRQARTHSGGQERRCRGPWHSWAGPQLSIPPVAAAATHLPQVQTESAGIKSRVAEPRPDPGDPNDDKGPFCRNFDANHFQSSEESARACRRKKVREGIWPHAGVIEQWEVGGRRIPKKYDIQITRLYT
jgi:hypothetical protein